MAASPVALVFPGQGCQYVGMGADLAYPEARQTYAEADDLLGFGITRLCHEGPEEILADTSNAQPAIYVTSMALWRVLQSRLDPVRYPIRVAAGHSLGEYVALTAAGALSFREGLRLVALRGQAMRDAGTQAPGGMAAILGMESAALAETLAEVNASRQAVWVANDNAPGQTVIAGEREALSQAVALAEVRGARRVVPLAVSVACHTPLMGVASERLANALRATSFAAPAMPVICNVTAETTSDRDEIRRNLLAQLTSPVRWVETVQRMAAIGVGASLEVGPKAVLSALSRRIDPAIATSSVTNAAEIESFLHEG